MTKVKLDRYTAEQRAAANTYCSMQGVMESLKKIMTGDPKSYLHEMTSFEMVEEIAKYMDEFYVQNMGKLEKHYEIED